MKIHFWDRTGVRDGGVGQQRQKVGEEAAGQEALPAHRFWDALIRIRPLSHPESHGKSSMAFLFSGQGIFPLPRRKEK